MLLPMFRKMSRSACSEANCSAGARLFGAAILWGLGFAIGCMPRIASAGGGPENVFVVVNSSDAKSMAIANHFVSYRNIPSGSVLNIDWPNPPHDTTLDEFRDRILAPTLAAIKKRSLGKQIDYIVYSSGFPYRVDLEQDIAGVKKGWASITSLTYLSDLVMGNRIPAIQGPSANAYAKKLRAREAVVTRGFSRRYAIDMMGDRTNANNDYAHRYYLSTMLAYTKGEKGNSLAEVLQYLILANRADGTTPKGSMYFVKQEDIRSKVRDKLFPFVIDQLAKEGVRGEEIEGAKDPVNILPRKKQDVMAAIVGYAKARWGDSGSTMLPGAIVDNFTSYGGRLGGGHSQVCLTHFLKYGAVAATGTVTEPYAILRKFPHPRMYVHYARGCSVAESYYQSVPQPFQLLIVGDPLCQPWAVAPDVEIKDLDTSKQLSGVIEFNVDAKSKQGNDIRSIELFVDGVFAKRVLPGKPVRFDTSRVADGFHELRAVAIEDTAVETQGRAITAFVSANLPQAVSDNQNQAQKNWKVEIRGSVQPENYLAMSALQTSYAQVSSPGASEIRLYHGRTLLGSTSGASGRIVIDATKVGGGPAFLQPIAFPRNRARKPVLGTPIKVDVQLPR